MFAIPSFALSALLDQNGNQKIGIEKIYSFV